MFPPVAVIILIVADAFRLMNNQADQRLHPYYRDSDNKTSYVLPLLSQGYDFNTSLYWIWVSCVIFSVLLFMLTMNSLRNVLTVTRRKKITIFGFLWFSFICLIVQAVIPLQQDFFQIFTNERKTPDSSVINLQGKNLTILSYVNLCAVTLFFTSALSHQLFVLLFAKKQLRNKKSIIFKTIVFYGSFFSFLLFLAVIVGYNAPGTHFRRFIDNVFEDGSFRFCVDGGLQRILMLFVMFFLGSYCFELSNDQNARKQQMFHETAQHQRMAFHAEEMQRKAGSSSARKKIKSSVGERVFRSGDEPSMALQKARQEELNA